MVGVVQRGSADGGKGATVVGVEQQGWRCLRWCRRYNIDGGDDGGGAVVMVVWWEKKIMMREIFDEERDLNMNVNKCV